MKKRLKKENNIVIDRIILLMSVVKVVSKLLLGKNPPDEIKVMARLVDFSPSLKRPVLEASEFV